MTVWLHAGPNAHRSAAGVVIWLSARYQPDTVERLAIAIDRAHIQPHKVKAARLEPDGTTTLYVVDGDGEWGIVEP